MTVKDWWPLHGLRLLTQRVELRLPSYDELFELGELAAQGIHDPAVMPFATPWSDVTPAERARSVVQAHWRALGGLSREEWQLPFTVFHDGTVVGVQDLNARRFSTLREVASGSWLGLAHQGKGIGTEMRAAVLHLAFAGLGAVSATSGAFTDNVRSDAVSRRLGYEPDGVDVKDRRGAPGTVQRYRLSRDRWAEHATVEVVVEGLGDGVREMLGAEAA